MPDLPDAWAKARRDEREERDRALEREQTLADRLAAALTPTDAPLTDATPADTTDG